MRVDEEAVRADFAATAAEVDAGRRDVRAGLCRLAAQGVLQGGAGFRAGSPTRRPHDLTDAPRAGDPLPPLWHWFHLLDHPRRSELGDDGYPAEGRFLPPLPHRRRMIAGGRLRVVEPMRIGEEVVRRSEQASVEVKTGRTGRMVFVAGFDYRLSRPVFAGVTVVTRGVDVDGRLDLAAGAAGRSDAITGTAVLRP